MIDFIIIRKKGIGSGGEGDGASKGNEDGRYEKTASAVTSQADQSL